MSSLAMYKDQGSISKFIAAHPQGNIFQTPEMADIYAKSAKHEPVQVVIEDKGEIAGVLLAGIQREHTGVLGTFSSGSIIWGGPLIKNNDPVFLDLVLKEYRKKVKRKVIYSQFRNLWKWNAEESKVFEQNGFTYEDHLDILHDLTISPDQQLMKMHAGRRKNIRRTEKSGVVFKEVTDRKEFEDCLELVNNTYRKIKLPLPDRSFFMETFNALYPAGVLKTFALTHSDEIIGTRMVLCFKDLIYDWFAGSSDNHLDKYPNDYLPWKIMEWGSEHHYKVFDFGGAGKPDKEYGVRDYKLKFGGELVNHGRYEIIHKPMLMQLGRLLLALYKKI